jgi:L-asparagine transporter-like permease
MMVIAIALVTVGRITSKKAKTEQGKHLRIAVFYLIALALMLWMIPWPFTAMGEGRGWI